MSKEEEPPEAEEEAQELDADAKMGLLDGLITGLARKSKFGRSHSLRPLTSKRANRRFYKGNGCRNEGVHAKRGRYVVDQDKLLQLEVPDLTGFKLKAYVSPLTPNRRPDPQ